MKIIQVDNFNREQCSDILIVDGLTEYWANRIADALNATGGVNASFCYKAVQDDHKLYQWEP